MPSFPAEADKKKFHDQRSYKNGARDERRMGILGGFLWMRYLGNIALAKLSVASEERQSRPNGWLSFCSYVGHGSWGFCVECQRTPTPHRSAGRVQFREFSGFPEFH